MIGSCCNIVILCSHRNVYDLSPLRLQPIWHLFQWFLLCVRCSFIFVDLWQVSEVSPVTPCDGSAISWEKSSHLIESHVPPPWSTSENRSQAQTMLAKAIVWKYLRENLRVCQGIFCAGYLFFWIPLSLCLGEDFVTTSHAEWQPVTAS